MTSVSQRSRIRKGIGGLRKRLRSGCRRALQVAREPGWPSVDIVLPSTWRGTGFPNLVGYMEISSRNRIHPQCAALLCSLLPTGVLIALCEVGLRVDLEALGSCLPG